MEKSTFIGLILGLLAVAVGMILKGAHLSVLWNPAAIMIIFVGTAATLFMGFPLKELKKFPKLIRLIFTEQKLMPKTELIKLFVNLATITRREGLLALDSHMENIDDKFLKSGIQMIIDGSDIEFVKNVMLEEIDATEERHHAGALIFSQAGTYAPTLGVLGAVVGLIAALGNLSDIEILGHSIAAAFVATLMGIFSGYVLWHPIANKLKRLSSEEMQLKHIMVEGVVAIGSGISPIALEQYLLVYLSQEERDQSGIQKEDAGDGE